MPNSTKRCTEQNAQLAFTAQQTTDHILQLEHEVSDKHNQIVALTPPPVIQNPPPPVEEPRVVMDFRGQKDIFVSVYGGMPSSGNCNSIPRLDVTEIHIDAHINCMSASIDSTIARMYPNLEKLYVYNCPMVPYLHALCNMNLKELHAPGASRNERTEARLDRTWTGKIKQKVVVYT